MNRIIAAAWLCFLLCLHPTWAQAVSNVVPAASQQVTAKLAFTAGGDITGPSGKVSIGQRGGIAITTATGDIYSLTVPTIVRGGKTHGTAAGLADRAVMGDTVAAYPGNTYRKLFTEPPRKTTLSSACDSNPDSSDCRKPEYLIFPEGKALCKVPHLNGVDDAAVASTMSKKQYDMNSIIGISPAPALKQNIT